MYDDVDIPLPKTATLAEIRLPLPLRLLILRGHPVYDTDREQLQWMYRSYYGAISHIDREIGLIMRTLKDAGVAANTIVNGTARITAIAALEHGLQGKNCFFESSVRVRDCTGIPARSAPASTTNWSSQSTFCPRCLTSRDSTGRTKTRGRSLVPLITDSDRRYSPRECVFSERHSEVITSSRTDFEFIKGRRHQGASRFIPTPKWFAPAAGSSTITAMARSCTTCRTIRRRDQPRRERAPPGRLRNERPPVALVEHRRRTRARSPPLAAVALAFVTDRLNNRLRNYSARQPACYFQSHTSTRRLSFSDLRVNCSQRFRCRCGPRTQTRGTRSSVRF